MKYRKFTKAIISTFVISFLFTTFFSSCACAQGIYGRDTFVKVSFASIGGHSMWQDFPIFLQNNRIFLPIETEFLIILGIDLKRSGDDVELSYTTEEGKPPLFISRKDIVSINKKDYFQSDRIMRFGINVTYGRTPNKDIYVAINSPKLYGKETAKTFYEYCRRITEQSPIREQEMVSVKQVKPEKEEKIQVDREKKEISVPKPIIPSVIPEKPEQFTDEIIKEEPPTAATATTTAITQMAEKPTEVQVRATPNEKKVKPGQLATLIMGMTNAEIETELSSYNEQGYKFLEKLTTGMWKVLYGRPNWKLGWEVVVASTSPDPENSFVVIGTTVLSTKSVTFELLLQLLSENSYDTNPGNYSIFAEDDVFYIQYIVKIPQMLLNEEVLKKGIGFVAAYSNSHARNLEKMLAGEQSEPTQESSPESKSSPKQNEEKNK